MIRKTISFGSVVGTAAKATEQQRNFYCHIIKSFSVAKSIGKWRKQCSNVWPELTAQCSVFALFLTGKRKKCPRNFTWQINIVNEFELILSQCNSIPFTLKREIQPITLVKFHRSRAKRETFYLIFFIFICQRTQNWWKHRKT